MHIILIILMKIFEAILQSPLGEILIKDNGKAILEVCFVDSQNSSQSNANPLTLEAIRKLKECLLCNAKSLICLYRPMEQNFKNRFRKSFVRFPMEKSKPMAQ
ncbi:hypothetical protein [Helicobacter sp. UBA3407]|uniref:hypothetical protein n=2 Tax=Helicobacter TaxID=209 RepID=UPI00262F9E31|nr:hypothetical protein [Helicobacter sp. UBA3407]